MRVVVCGEALIDLMPVERSVAATIPTGIPGSNEPSYWVGLPGGSPMNTAIALARQGQQVAFLGRLGNDRFADELLTHLDRSRVGTELVVRADSPTSIAVVSPNPVGPTHYSFHLNGTANFGWQRQDLPQLSESDWLHFGSLACIVEPGATELLRWLRRVDCPMSFDVNVRSTVLADRAEYWSRVEQLLYVVGSQAGVLKASADDLAWLADAEDDPDFDPLELAAGWAVAYDLAMVLVTLGADGAAAVKPDGRVERANSFPVEVVDTVGAGDTFTAGFLSAWLADPTDPAAALRRGCAASALVCQRQGANPPTNQEIDAFLAERLGSE